MLLASVFLLFVVYLICVGMSDSKSPTAGGSGKMPARSDWDYDEAFPTSGGLFSTSVLKPQSYRMGMTDITKIGL